MRRERELERALREAPLPGEGEAEERSWEVVRAAYAQRATMPPARRARGLALALAVGALALAIGLSPAGARVGELVSEMVGVGEPHARPGLRSLPTAGELLVESEQGPWIVRSDGSKRLLGDYDQATWSPHGLFVAVTKGRELIAVEPDGDVRWTIDAPSRVRDPRWSPSGYRIAYRSGADLRVVAADGTDDRLVARDVAPVAPAWRPTGDSKLGSLPGGIGSHVLTYVEGDEDVRTVDVDGGRRRPTNKHDLEMLTTPAQGQTVGPALSPRGTWIAALRPAGRRTELVLHRAPRHGTGRGRVLFSARGRLTGPTWSPDGRWLLIGWPAADQWLFIRTDCADCVIPVDHISKQFDPGATGHGRFPRASGWILPRR